MDKIKVVFTSNFLVLHQIPFCNRMYAILGDDFKFIATVSISNERLRLGYEDLNDKFPYVIKAYASDENRKIAMKYANDADVLIHGSAPVEYAVQRFKANKIVFNYCERLFKKGFHIMMDPRLIKQFYIRHTANRKRNVYLLCASAYTSYDMKRIFAYPDKMFKWGYFPEMIRYSENEIMENKKNETIKLLWAGRLIDWKHPEKALLIARYLKEKRYKFHLDIVGTGDLEESLKQSCVEYGMEDCVAFPGSMPTDQVRRYMERANIFLFTSNREEGWGAVLNEAMNSGCAVVASNKIGAVPFLLRDNENGFVFIENNFMDLCKKVERLIKDKELCLELGMNAYKTLANLWNADIATERLLKTLTKLVKTKEMETFDDGPLSKAQILKG